MLGFVDTWFGNLVKKTKQTEFKQIKEVFRSKHINIKRLKEKLRVIPKLEEIVKGERNEDRERERERERLDDSEDFSKIRKIEEIQIKGKVRKDKSVRDKENGIKY